MGRSNSFIDWAVAGRELVGGGSDVYVIRVSGESVEDAIADEGDLVVLKPKESVREGEMVAAWLKGERKLTLSYYFRENGHVRLAPAGSTSPPVRLKLSDVEIRGEVLAIVRKTR